MKIKLFPILLILLFQTLNQINAQEIYKLWEGEKMPYHKDNDLQEHEKEAWGTLCVFDITEPTLTIYRAKGHNTGKAVLIIPGGGYELVAMYHEGYDLGKALSEQGITAAVLKYRLPNPKSSDQPHLVPMTDARRALKLLRKKSLTYNFQIDKVGVLGFSAGSHLATVLGLWESPDSNENPNFSGLVYGVTKLTKANLKWLEKSLYHRPLTSEEIERNTLLNLVSDSTPPAFLVHAYDDETCHVEETTLYAQKLREHGVWTEMHLFPKGGHGFGMGRKSDGTDQWVPLFVNWIKRL